MNRATLALASHDSSQRGQEGSFISLSLSLSRSFLLRPCNVPWYLWDESCSFHLSASSIKHRQTQTFALIEKPEKIYTKALEQDKVNACKLVNVTLNAGQVSMIHFWITDSRDDARHKGVHWLRALCYTRTFNFFLPCVICTRIEKKVHANWRSGLLSEWERGKTGALIENVH